MTHARRLTAVCTALLLASLTAAACRKNPPPAPVAPPPPAPAPAAYVPGLGELMSFQQMRHTKLWFAGDAKNWNLAAYEVEELKEGFDDVIALHPTWKKSPVNPKDAIPIMIADPIEQVKAAIDKKDSKLFAESYDALTNACNACHQATDFGFNVVQRPKTNPYANQVFTPAK